MAPVIDQSPRAPLLPVEARAMADPPCTAERGQTALRHHLYRPGTKASRLRGRKQVGEVG
jgi:hypothetical protein